MTDTLIAAAAIAVDLTFVNEVTQTHTNVRTGTLGPQLDAYGNYIGRVRACSY